MVYVHTMETPQDMIDKGKMHINVYDKQQGIPLADARISLAYTGNPERKIFLILALYGKLILMNF